MINWILDQVRHDGNEEKKQTTCRFQQMQAGPCQPTSLTVELGMAHIYEMQESVNTGTL